MEKSQRLIVANKLKAAFNILWDRAMEISEKRGQSDTISYKDIVRIADAIRADGPKILGLSSLPKQIDSGLSFACAACDPNKARSQETIKQGVSGLCGTGGLILVWACLGQLINPGIWAGIVAFVAGGVAGGPLAIAGVGAGLLIAASAVYAAFQKMQPNERAAKAYSYVINGIDNWIEYGSDDIAISYEEVRKVIEMNAAHYGLSFNDVLASASLMMNVANADGIFADIERHTINVLLSNPEVERRLKTSEALNYVKRCSSNKASEVLDWCFQVAHADGKFHSHEVEVLKRYCLELNVDFGSKAKLYGIKVSLEPI